MIVCATANDLKAVRQWLSAQQPGAAGISEAAVAAAAAASHRV